MGRERMGKWYRGGINDNRDEYGSWMKSFWNLPPQDDKCHWRWVCETQDQRKPLNLPWEESSRVGGEGSGWVVHLGRLGLWHWQRMKSVEWFLCPQGRPRSRDTTMTYRDPADRPKRQLSLILRNQRSRFKWNNWNLTRFLHGGKHLLFTLSVSWGFVKPLLFYSPNFDIYQSWVEDSGIGQD